MYSTVHRDSFSIWYCRLRNDVCTTARRVASFHPRMRVWSEAATLVLPEARSLMKDANASVMKPTKVAKMTKPKMMITMKIQRRPTLSGMESSNPPVAMS